MPIAKVLTPFVVALTLALALPVSASATDWRQFRYDVAQSGSNDAETTLTSATVGDLQKAWDTSAGEAVELAAPLVIGDETIVSAAPATVAAFKTSTGELLWSFDAPAGHLGDPISANRRRVYVQSADGPMYALNVQTGKLVWKRGLGGISFSGATVAQGVAYVPAGNDLYALNAVTGVTVWRRSADAEGCISTPAVTNGLVVVSTSGSVIAFDTASGDIVWSQDGKNGNCAAVSIVGDGVFIGPYRSTAKLDLATGHIVWRKFVAPGNRLSSSPAVGDGLVVIKVARSDPAQEILKARSAVTGEPVWSAAYPVGNVLPGLRSSPAIANGVVYAGFTDGSVRAFDATSGELLWDEALDGPVLSSPSIANGQLEIGTLAGTLFAFRAPGS